MCKMIRSPWKRPCSPGGVALVVMMFTPIELPKRPCPLPHLPTPGSRGRRKKKTQVVSIYLYACELHALSQMQLREVSMMGIF